MGLKLKESFLGVRRLRKPEEWNLQSPMSYRGPFEVMHEPKGRVRRLWGRTCQAPWPPGGLFVPSRWLRGKRVRRPHGRREPLDVRQFLRTLQKVDLTSDQQLLDFINRWGSLGVGTGVTEGNGCPQLLSPPQAGRTRRAGRRSARWAAERPMRDDFFLFDGVEATRAHLKRVQTWQEAFYALQHGRPTNATWSTLADGLFAHLAEVRLCAVLRAQGLRVSYVTPRPIDSVWLELWDRATGGTRLRRCKECGALFPPSRRDQIYCTRLCANRPAVRRWKQQRRATAVAARADQTDPEGSDE